MVNCEKVTEYVSKLCREVEELRRENAELRAELRTYKPRTRRSKGSAEPVEEDAREKSKHRTARE